MNLNKHNIATSNNLLVRIFELLENGPMTRKEIQDTLKISAPHFGVTIGRCANGVLIQDGKTYSLSPEYVKIMRGIDQVLKGGEC